MKLKTTVAHRGSEKQRTAWRCMKCTSRYSARGMYYTNYKDPCRIFIVQYMTMHNYPTDIVPRRTSGNLKTSEPKASETLCALIMAAQRHYPNSPPPSLLVA